MENRYLEVVKIKKHEKLGNVVSSRVVADQLGKEHSDVMRKIKEVLGVGEFSESSYINSQNKIQPEMLLTKNGFILLCMNYQGYNEFKRAYIAEFDRMEEELNKPMTIEEMIINQAKSVLELKDKVVNIEKIVDNQLTIDHGRQRTIQRKISIRVYNRIEELYKDETITLISTPKLFKNIYRELKNKFAVASYKDILLKDYELALNFIDGWVEDKELRG